MANFDLNPNGDLFPDKRVVGRQTTTTTAKTIAAFSNYDNIETMRTALAAANGAYYTAARLNQMSENDMHYAARLQFDSASL